MVWKKTKDGLVHTTDENRINIKTRIYATDMKDLLRYEVERETTISYLLENGLENMFKKEGITFTPKTRAKGKVYFKGNLDKDLVERVRKTAKEHDVKITNIFDEAIRHIDLDTVKHKSWAHRIE